MFRSGRPTRSEHLRRTWRQGRAVRGEHLDRTGLGRVSGPYGPITGGVEPVVTQGWQYERRPAGVHGCNQRLHKCLKPLPAAASPCCGGIDDRSGDMSPPPVAKKLGTRSGIPVRSVGSAPAKRDQTNAHSDRHNWSRTRGAHGESCNPRVSYHGS